MNVVANFYGIATGCAPEDGLRDFGAAELWSVAQLPEAISVLKRGLFCRSRHHQAFILPNPARCSGWVASACSINVIDWSVSPKNSWASARIGTRSPRGSMSGPASVRERTRCALSLKFARYSTIEVIISASRRLNSHVAFGLILSTSRTARQASSGFGVTAFVKRRYKRHRTNVGLLGNRRWPSSHQ